MNELEGLIELIRLEQSGDDESRIASFTAMRRVKP
jgi:hypothetical protein